MADSNPLAQLRDIHLPKSIGFWPLAPGWYFLFILSLSLGIFLVYKIRQHRLRVKAKNEALSLLKNYEQQYLRDMDCQKASMQISELLRRVALAYFAREKVAGLKGEAWLDFLQSTSKKINANNLAPLLHLPYMPKQEMDLKPLFAEAKCWIKERGEHV